MDETVLFKVSTQERAVCGAAMAQDDPTTWQIEAAFRSDLWWTKRDPDVESQLREGGLLPPQFEGYAGTLLSTSASTVVLSLTSEITQKVLRHRATGALFAPLLDWEAQGTGEGKRQLAAEFDDAGPLSADESIQNFERAIQSLVGKSVILVNAFRAVPDARPTSYTGLPETLRERIRHLNLGAMRLSALYGAYVVDIDAALAHVGAVALGTDYRLAGGRGLELAATELARVIHLPSREPCESPEGP